MIKTFALFGGLALFFLSVAGAYFFFTRQTELASHQSTVDDNILGATENQGTDIIKEINYWKDVVNNHPDFRDGYMQLASLTYQMNNLAAAIDYVNKVLELDPNFQPAKDLKNILSAGD